MDGVEEKARGRSGAKRSDDRIERGRDERHGTLNAVKMRTCRYARVGYSASELTKIGKPIKLTTELYILPEGPETYYIHSEWAWTV